MFSYKHYVVLGFKVCQQKYNWLKQYTLGYILHGILSNIVTNNKTLKYFFLS